MTLIIWLCMLGSVVWVGIDASNLGVKRGRLGGGGLDMSIASWVVCCLLLWIVAFPCYMVARDKYKQLQRGPQWAPGGYAPVPQQAWAAPQVPGQPVYGYAPVPQEVWAAPQAPAAPQYGQFQTPAPVAQAPVAPAPVAPVVPAAPVTPAPVAAAPVAAEPVVQAPVEVAPVAAAPPQYSPNGQWWWTGTEWVPATQR